MLMFPPSRGDSADQREKWWGRERQESTVRADYKMLFSAPINYSIHKQYFGLRVNMKKYLHSPGQNTGVGSFPFSRGSSQPRDPAQVSCIAGWTLYQLSHKGSPRILEWVAYPFSRGSSQPRNQTGASCIAGGFFTNWDVREAFPFIFIRTMCFFLFLNSSGIFRALVPPNQRKNTVFKKQN